VADNVGSVAEGTLLWEPSAQLAAGSNMTRFMHWLRDERGRDFVGYDALWRWSVEDLDGFWAAVWDYFGIIAHTPYTEVVAPAPDGKRVEGARWFTGSTLNYAEHALRRRDDAVGVIAVHESGYREDVTFAQLAQRVAETAAGLARLGVGKGDAVVGFLPNVPEALVGMLAAASLGAAWSSCPPEFGVTSVIERFVQLEPKVLLAADGYTYAGKRFDSLPAVARIQEGLPTLTSTVVLGYLAKVTGTPGGSLDGLRDAMPWEALPVTGAELSFTPVPFDHPLWVLYSSGTTGAPKAIVHRHGGVTVEHHKSHALHLDLGPDDRFFWFTTTGWMMWNYLVSSLLVGAGMVMFDGNPVHPTPDALWKVAADTGITNFGVSAPYILNCMKAGIEPGRAHDLSAMKVVGSTGAPLPPEGMAWVYEHVGRDVLMANVSGGTDTVTAFVMSSPTLPIHAGEMQCRGLGCRVESYDESGRPVIGEVGELVITQPLPSMPVRFLNDPDGSKLHESYFAVYPDTWRHGDWLKITERGTCVIYGRSDSTLNRSGVRMGTSEFYRVVEEVPEVLDSLVVDTSMLGTEGKLLLFVVLREGAVLDDGLRKRIATRIREDLSPRHVPDEAYAIAEVPRTLNGKKLEVPVKKILNGVAPEQAVSRDALGNPQALDTFIALAAKLASR
jgi:acetoacetyl-CoA synthetase